MNHYNCVYLYTNKINGKKYVGQTNDLNRRHKEHISISKSETRRNSNVPFHLALRKYGEESFTVEILIENLESQELLNYYETLYIKELNTLANNGHGYNVSSGGSNGNPYAGKTEEEMMKISKKKSESRKGMVFTEEHKANISKNSYMKNIEKEQHPFYGKHHTEESNERNRQAHLGKLHTQETKDKISASLKGGNSSSARITLQYDKEGNFIKRWDCAKDASRELGISNSAICACARGTRKTAGGFVWKYE